MDVETVVLGAGVVGLAVAAELSSRGGTVLVVERNTKLGQETSSHNSEVLHAGLYYPTGSLKARLCLEGNERIQALSRERGIPVQMLGKIVVAGPDEIAALDALMARAAANGVVGLRRVSGRELRLLEPSVVAAEAMLSSNTGILDSDALMQYFLVTAEDAGAEFVYRTEVVGLSPIQGGYRVDTRGPDGELFSIEAARVVNAAGLYADRVAAMAGIDIDQAGYRLHFCRGDYFSTRPRCWRLVSRLVYPVPGAHAAGLGIHVTLDMGGRMRLGPDTTYLEPGKPPEYAVNPTSKARFAAAVRRYLPAIEEDDLEPEFAGTRPKLQGPGDPARDFIIAEETQRGLPGLVNLVGIESPGLTASPAIAREVARLLSA